MTTPEDAPDSAPGEEANPDVPQQGDGTAEQTDRTASGATSKARAPRKRTPRPVASEPVAEPAAEPVAEAEPESDPDAGAIAETETTPDVPDVLESEEVSEDLARDEGTTGGPIEQAALAAVADAPASFSSPAHASVPSANGSSVNSAFAARPTSSSSIAGSTRDAAVKRLAPAVGIAAVAALIIWRKRR